MKKMSISESEKELFELCDTVRKLVAQNKFIECKVPIQDAMAKYPHAPQPHNLIGIVLEMEGDHMTAMNHFRAAWALDSTYIPARFNMKRFGSFSPKGKCAFDETDCPQ